MMTHLTTENLIAVTEKLVTHPRWTTAMASIGASEQLAFNWLSRSRAAQKADDRASPFYVEWREVWAFWHEHCGRARRESLVAYDAIIRHQAMHGVEVPVLGPDNQVVYKLDPKYIGWSNDDFENFGMDPRRDRYLKDANGNPIVQTRVEQLPATTRNKVLELIPDYQPTVNHNVRSKSVVHVVGERKPLPDLRRPDGSRPDLAELRRLAALPPKNPTPSHPVQKFGPNDSPPDRTSAFPAEDAPPRPAPSYARPSAPSDNPTGQRGAAPLDGAGRGRGVPPPGGFSVCR